MMPTPGTTLVISLISFFVAFISRIVMHPPAGDNKREAYAGAFLFGFLGSFAGFMATTSIGAQFLITRLEGRLASETPYDRVSRYVEHLPDDHTRVFFKRGLEGINRRLSLVEQGQLQIDRNEVFDFWTRLFEDATDQVWATNIVSESDWKFFGPDGDGRKIQEGAVKRGVKIIRIMVYDPDIPAHKDGLRRVGCLHRDVGVQVRELPQKALENPTYTAWLTQLGTPDMVLYDQKHLLLTHTARDQTIRWSFLTINPEMRASAREFYSRLLEASAELPPCPELRLP